MKAVAASVLIEVINHPFEERNIEFKQSTRWRDKTFKAKITKSILAMANIRDGGWIVIGKEKQDDGTYCAVGMSQPDYDSYDSDQVKDFVKDYADPHVNCSVSKRTIGQDRYVVIRVDEFERIPVICKESCGDILHRGKIYTRSRGKPESIEIPSQTEMREIIDIAVEKENRHFFERLFRLGLPSQRVEPVASNDKESYEKQLEGIL